MRFACMSLFLSMTAAPQAGFAADHWVGTWAASPVAAKNPGGVFGMAAMNPTDATAGAAGSTLREIVHVSIGGSSVRVTLSNEFGLDPLTIGEAALAVRATGSSFAPGSSVPLTFGGRASVTIPAGALMVSDAASLKIAPLSDLAVSLFLPDQPVNQLTFHALADQTNYLAAGNVVSAASLDSPKEIFSWDFLKGIDVMAGESGAAIVTFGDSITDGTLSTRNANARWPDVLAHRLQANKKTAHVGVLNEGISGNRVLHDVTGPSALARFDRDVIAQTGVKYVILLESINDIGHAADPVKPFDIVSADDIIAGLAQLALRAHSHGIKVIGATLTPYMGAKYSSPAGEVLRQAVNSWIRSTKELDGVIDFEKVTRDPANPAAFSPAADSGDHLHPKDAGYKMMGDSIDLKMFER